MFESRSKSLRKQGARESGSALFLSMVIVVLLLGLSMAQLATLQHNLRQSHSFHLRGAFLNYAESGIALALHELRHDTVKDRKGLIGTSGWWEDQHDYGRDGTPFTHDEGEGDGIPTFGEPNVFPAPVGKDILGGGLIVYVDDTAYPGIQRIVATAGNGDVSATIEKYVREYSLPIPKIGAFYVDSAAPVNLDGDVIIDGHDHRPNGARSAGLALPGVGVPPGATAGENKASVISTLHPRYYNRILGAGGKPSIEEIPDVRFDELFDFFALAKTQTVPSGTHSAKVQLGYPTPGNLQITHVTGDLHLAGNGVGAGVLVVDGSLKVTGDFYFAGLVMVKGDFRIAGNARVAGSVMVDELLVAVEKTTKGQKVSGTARIYYSSEVLDAISANLPPVYAPVYYDER